ncbi:hypothetical protein SRHO_G00265690 [Serrasalmus rhombeus]
MLLWAWPRRSFANMSEALMQLVIKTNDLQKQPGSERGGLQSERLWFQRGNELNFSYLITVDRFTSSSALNEASAFASFDVLVLLNISVSCMVATLGSILEATPLSPKGLLIGL